MREQDGIDLSAALFLLGFIGVMCIFMWWLLDAAQPIVP